MTKSRGLYAEVRFPKPLIPGRHEYVAVYSVEAEKGMFAHLVKAFAAIAEAQGLTEIEISYRSRKIRNGVMEPIDLV
jgi:hypothetical protein